MMSTLRAQRKSGPKLLAGKRPLDIQTALRRIRQAVKPFPQAALFELAADGYDSVFEVLVGCIISIRTRDEVTVPTARRLFERARAPEEVASLTPGEIDDLIGACTFHKPKARQIYEIARRAAEEFDGKIPCDPEALLSFHGVGLKCANLT